MVPQVFECLVKLGPDFREKVHPVSSALAQGNNLWRPIFFTKNVNLN